MGRRLWCGLALALVAGCRAGAGLADGPARTYRLGEPDAALDAVATVRGDTAGIDVALLVAPSSLTYRPAGDSLEAVVDWTVRVDGPRPTFETGADTLRAATVEAARAAPPAVYTARVDRPPGAYRVEGTVTDVGADRTARRADVVTVSAPDGGPWLGGLRLVDAAGRPLAPTRLPAASDSVRLVAQAAGGDTLLATVVRLAADTTVAAPLPGAAPPPGSLATRGVDAGDRDTVWTLRRPLAEGGAARGGAGEVAVALPALAPGVYAVGLDAGGASASRRVVVRRRDYPLVTRLGDLVDPLAYLADPGELEAVRRGGRRAFDAFWGRYADDRRRAAATLATFYERVEQANRLFGNHEAGWATDPGMVYVVFGPPDDVRPTPTGETWSYRRGGTAPPQVVFDRTAARSAEGSPFAVLTARRDRRFGGAWRAARAAWRAGRVP